MRQMKEHRPKFKVGDNVKHIWSDNATTVAEITSKGYRMESGDEFVDFEDEFFWELAHKSEPTTKPIHKFNIGDIVQRKDGCFFQYKITGYDGDDYVAVDTFKLKRGLKSPFDITKIGRNDNDYELVEKAESNVQPIEPKFKIGVDLSVGNDVDNIWRNTLTDLVSGVTQRNTDAFLWLIDETLRYMDCDAYVEDARAGMRQFVKELKKRLGV